MGLLLDEGEEEEELSPPFFFASAFAAAEYTSALAACVLVQPSASLAATSWKSPMRVLNCFRCAA